MFGGRPPLQKGVTFNLPVIRNLPHLTTTTYGRLAELVLSATGRDSDLTLFDYGREDIGDFAQMILDDALDEVAVMPKSELNQIYHNIRSLYVDYKRGYKDNPTEMGDDLSMLLAVGHSQYIGLTDKQMANFEIWGNEVNPKIQELNQKLTSLQSSKDQEIASKDQEIAAKDQEIQNLQKKLSQGNRAQIKHKVAAITKILSSM